MSGGEKQKIACGSAAAIDPDVYVLDEPSSNLDAYAIADFRQLLFTLKSQGKTIIISEHRLYYLSGLFDRVLYLKDGEIEGDYTAEEFCGLSAKQRDDMGLRPLDLAGLSEIEGPPQRMNEAVWTIKNVSFAYKHEPETLHITETSFPSAAPRPSSDIMVRENPPLPGASAGWKSISKERCRIRARTIPEKND